MPFRRLLALAALWTALAPSPGARAQMVSVTVDPVTFFDDDPAWLLGVRALLGFDDEGALWPQLGLQAGYAFPSHLFLALTFDARLTDPWNLRVGGRVGALFRRRILDIGFGTGLSLLSIPGQRDLGPVPTTWVELRWKLSQQHRLTFALENDILVEQLGFDRGGALFGVGLGWALLF
jgi:hypothetical protein